MHVDDSVGGLLGRTAEPLRYGDGSQETAELIRAMMPDQCRVLDVGCGAGGLTVAVNLGKRNNVTCLELDAERALAARIKGLKVIEAPLDATFAASGETFDVVVFADVLEHMTDPAAALRAAKGVLSQDGKILVSVPNVAHWTVRLRLLMGQWEYTDVGIMDATHLRWFTAASLRRIVEGAGFSVSRTNTSAGLNLPTYRKLPMAFRTHAIAFLQKAQPGLFGYQHIIEAMPQVQP